tara:strand:+ start:4055 stop:4597 length:543 start_codon:yes stop_codon:yes gene_type:complete
MGRRLTLLENLVGFLGLYTEFIIFPFVLFLLLYNFLYIEKLNTKEERTEKRQSFLFGVMIFVALILLIVFLKLPLLLREQNQDMISTINEHSTKWGEIVESSKTFFTDQTTGFINSLYKNFDKTMVQLTTQSTLVKALYGKAYKPPQRELIDSDNLWFPSVASNASAPEYIMKTPSAPKS